MTTIQKFASIIQEAVKKHQHVTIYMKSGIKFTGWPHAPDTVHNVFELHEFKKTTCTLIAIDEIAAIRPIDAVDE